MNGASPRCSANSACSQHSAPSHSMSRFAAGGWSNPACLSAGRPRSIWRSAVLLDHLILFQCAITEGQPAVDGELAQRAALA